MPAKATWWCNAEQERHAGAGVVSHFQKDRRWQAGRRSRAAVAATRGGAGTASPLSQRGVAPGLSRDNGWVGRSEHFPRFSIEQTKCKLSSRGWDLGVPQRYLQAELGNITSNLPLIFESSLVPLRMWGPCGCRPSPANSDSLAHGCTTSYKSTTRTKGSLWARRDGRPPTTRPHTRGNTSLQHPHSLYTT